MLLAYNLSKETVTTIMMLYKNIKAMIHSPDGNTNFKIIVRVLQRDTLASYLFICYLDYILRTAADLIKEKGFTVKK